MNVFFFCKNDNSSKFSYLQVGYKIKLVFETYKMQTKLEKMFDQQ